MSALMRLLAIEEANSSKAAETELTIYAKIGNIEGLKSANASEKQVQVEAQLGKSNRCRVRETTKDGKVTYVYTFKLKSDGDSAINSCQEFNQTVDHVFFLGFMKAADTVQLKTRFEFISKNVTLVIGDKTVTVPEIVYEVDVFTNKDGELVEWCKIDVEVDGLLEYLAKHHPEIKDVKLNVKVSNLPLELSGAFIDSQKTPEQEKLLNHLWDTQYKQQLKGGGNDG